MNRETTELINAAIDKAVADRGGPKSVYTAPRLHIYEESQPARRSGEESIAERVILAREALAVKREGSFRSDALDGVFRTDNVQPGDRLCKLCGSVVKEGFLHVLEQDGSCSVHRSPR